MFGLRATYHTTTQATPSQLVFGRDAILNTVFQANWKYIRDRKQAIISKNNKRENKKRIPHTYQVGDKILLDKGDIKTNLIPNMKDCIKWSKSTTMVLSEFNKAQLPIQ